MVLESISVAKVISDGTHDTCEEWHFKTSVSFVIPQPYSGQLWQTDNMLNILRHEQVTSVVCSSKANTYTLR